MNGVSRREAVEELERQVTPTRPAMAGRWTIAFVLPPIAMCDADRVLERLARQDAARPEVLAHHLDDPLPRLPRRATSAASRGAGSPRPPGSVMPSDSAIEAIVEAVPMTMQWP